MDWIDVKEANPKKYGVYLVTIEGITPADNYTDFCIWDTNKNEFGWYSSGRMGQE